MVADITSFITEKLIAYRIVLPIVFIEHVKKEEKKKWFNVINSLK